MRVLLTGHNGFIGSVMAPMLVGAGHEVVGLDSFFFEECTFGPPAPDIAAIRADLRDIDPGMLRGFDAVIHLAALSNDPLGNLSAECTYSINYRASVRLARLAKAAGISRFLYASSCSLYGVSGDAILAEDAPFNPVTPYARSKVLVEQELSKLADDGFSPTFMRNATAYGVSPRLRVDLVVNSLVGFAFTTGEVFNLSDGTPWRPLIHVQDIGRAFLAALDAPREAVHNQAFNVGSSMENYRIREVSEMVREAVPGTRIRYAEGAGPDPRCYRVDCSKIAEVLQFRPTWTVRRGIAELYSAFQTFGLTAEDFGGKYVRLRHIQKLIDQGLVDSELRWKDANDSARVSAARSSSPAARS